MTGQEWLDYFMADQQKKRKNDWMDMAGTGLGAGIGMLVGGPAGAVAGSQIGGAAGGLGEAASNKELTPGGVVGGVAQGVGGYGGLTKAIDQKKLMELLAQMGGQPMGFAGGGVVPGRTLMELLNGGGPLMADEPRPEPQPMVQAKHPGWEALAAILGDVASNLPAPRQTASSNKTIGAYMPAVGAGLSGIAERAGKGREAENKRRQESNIAAEESWRTGAREMSRRRWELVRDRMKPQGAASVGSQTYRVTADEAKVLKRLDWTDRDIPLAQVEQARRLNVQPPSAVTGVTYDKKVSQAKEIARRVMLGLTAPDMTGFRDMKPYVEAQLGDFNTAQAVLAYEATKTFVKQRESRLTQQQRNSMRAVQKQFALLEKFNEDYSVAAGGLRTAMAKPNASVLWMAENGLLGKDAEKLSRNLKGQTTLMADQIANIFMAGGVPTEKALVMAQEVLHAEWSEDQLASNTDMVKSDIAGRLAALNEARPMVETDYMPKPAAADSSKKVEWNW